MKIKFAMKILEIKIIFVIKIIFLYKKLFLILIKIILFSNKKVPLPILSKINLKFKKMFELWYLYIKEIKKLKVGCDECNCSWLCYWNLELVGSNLLLK